ncbi:MAG: S24 family peptidase [Aliarcobacter sp.]|nr:S24 family peptidase [Aliarcobacter sp.]
MQNYNEILEKIKDIFSQELGNKKILDKNIAAALEINYDNFRKQKARNKIPYYEIMSFLARRNISINWFFFNQLPESLIENTSNYIILKYQKNIIGSAGAGAINYSINSEPLIIDKQLLNYINSSYKYTEIIKVFGESMNPLIKDNSLIFIDTSIKDIKDKHTYVVNINGEIFIKQIIIKKDYYYLKSINLDYEDIKVKDLVVIGKVTGVFNKI